MKIGVVGAGSMGSFMGGHLHQAGHDVTLIDIRQDHIDTINQHGLIINKNNRKIVVRVPACTPDAIRERQDLLLLMVKSFHTESALLGIQNVIGPDTIIMTLQNGIGHVEKINKFIKPGNIIQGITSYPADLESPGHVSSTGRGIIKMMTADEHNSLELGEVCQAFKGGGLECEIAPQVRISIWEKLAFNAAMNGLSAILNLNVGELGDSVMGRELTTAIVAEVVHVAQKKRIHVLHERILATMDMAFSEHREHLPSMLKDIKSGKRTEVEAIHGAVIREGKTLGLALPVCETVYRMIRILEGKNPESIFRTMTRSSHV